VPVTKFTLYARGLNDYNRSAHFRQIFAVLVSVWEIGFPGSKTRKEINRHNSKISSISLICWKGIGMSIRFLRYAIVCGVFVTRLLAAQTLDQKIQAIDAYAERARVQWNVPGLAVSVVKDDKVLLAKGYGLREIGKPERVDENTLFAIASNSKAFTTAMLAMLVDERRLGWNDKVSQYLPELQMYDPYVTRELTIRDLVSHRSGLGTFSGDLLWYQTTYSEDEVLRRIRFLEPVNSFRAAYGYQNLMYIAAGRILEKITGKSWTDNVTERILGPLGMVHTKTSVTLLKPGDNSAIPHNELDGKMRTLRYDNVDNAKAAAALNSCVADLAQWLRLQLGRGAIGDKRLFSERQSWEMWQPNIAIPVTDASMRTNPTRHFNLYGLGWAIGDYQGRKVVAHGGGLDGMISRTAMMPEENLGIVVLSNSETSLSTALGNQIFDIMLGVAPQRDWGNEMLEQAGQGAKAAAEAQAKALAARLSNAGPSLNLPGYAGTYRCPMYGDVSIQVENERLVMRMVPAPALVADLEHWHYDTFRIHWRDTVSYAFPPGFVTFALDGRGITDELKINQPNNDFWFYELNLRRVK
jgi:CubicO group peptidase (beta-lactamase class C family)